MADDETEPSASSNLEGEGEGEGEGEVSLIDARLSPLSCFCDRSFCVIRVCENGVLCGRAVVEYSSTVDRIAVVISSLDV